MNTTAARTRTWAGAAVVSTGGSVLQRIAKAEPSIVCVPGVMLSFYYGVIHAG